MRGAYVGPHRNIHADVSGQARQNGADREAACRHPVQSQTEHNEQHHADHGDRRVLAIEIGLGAGLNGRSNFLHSGVAGTETQNRDHRKHTVKHGEHASDHSQPKPVSGIHEKTSGKSISSS